MAFQFEKGRSPVSKYANVEICHSWATCSTVQGSNTRDYVASLRSDSTRSTSVYEKLLYKIYATQFPNNCLRNFRQVNVVLDRSNNRGDSEAVFSCFHNMSFSCQQLEHVIQD